MLKLKNIFTIQKKDQDDYISEILEFDKDDEEYYASSSKTYIPNPELINLFSVINEAMIQKLEKSSEPINAEEDFVALDFMEENFSGLQFKSLKFTCPVSIGFHKGEFAVIQFYTNSEQEINRFVEKLKS